MDLRRATLAARSDPPHHRLLVLFPPRRLQISQAPFRSPCPQWTGSRNGQGVDRDLFWLHRGPCPQPMPRGFVRPECDAASGSRILATFRFLMGCGHFCKQSNFNCTPTIAEIELQVSLGQPLRALTKPFCPDLNPCVRRGGQDKKEDP